MTALWPFALAFAAILAAASYVDLHSLRIPDGLSVALLATGAAYWICRDASSLAGQIAFGLVVLLLFWAVRQVHWRLAGRVGLGLGDVKMAGAGAVWIVPAAFPLFLFAAAASGLACTLVFLMFNREGFRTFRVPFAPFLALGLMLAWTMEVTLP